MMDNILWVAFVGIPLVFVLFRLYKPFKKWLSSLGFAPQLMSLEKLDKYIGIGHQEYGNSFWITFDWTDYAYLVERGEEFRVINISEKESSEKRRFKLQVTNNPIYNFPVVYPNQEEPHDPKTT